MQQKQKRFRNDKKVGQQLFFVCEIVLQICCNFNGYIKFQKKKKEEDVARLRGNSENKNNKIVRKKIQMENETNIKPTNKYLFPQNKNYSPHHKKYRKNTEINV